MNVPLVVFKSDVSQAYRRLPLHFLWQLFKSLQLVHEARRSEQQFRQSRGWRFMGAFMGVVLWIANFRQGDSRPIRLC